MHLAAAPEETPLVQAGVEKNSPNAPVATGRADARNVLKRLLIPVTKGINGPW